MGGKTKKPSKADNVRHIFLLSGIKMKGKPFPVSVGDRKELCLKKDLKQKSAGSFPIFQCIIVLLLCLLFCCFVVPGLFDRSDTAPPETKTQTTVQKENAAFTKLCDELFSSALKNDQLARNYTLAEPEKYGISRTPTTLGDDSPDTLKQGYAADRKLLEQLQEFSTESLSKDQKLLYQILLHETRLSLEKEPFFLYTEPLRPQSGVTSGLPVILSEYQFRDEADIRNYLSLLKTFPDYFESIVKLEREKAAAGLFMNDKWKEKILHQCDAFIDAGDQCILITSFEQRLHSLSFSLTEETINAYQEENQSIVEKEVFCAYRLLANELRQLKNNSSASEGSGMGTTDEGKKYYELLVRSTTGSDRTVDELEEFIDRSITDLRNDLKKNLADPKVLVQLDDYEFPSDRPKECLKLLKDGILSDFTSLEQIAAQQQITIPAGSIYTVKKVSPSVQEFLSPAFYLTPPFDHAFENVIYINPHYENESLFTTLGHEGYPGHMYQMVYFSLLKKHPLRYLLSFPGYSEGWGLYAEVFSYRLAGLSDGLTAVLQDQLLLSMAFYSKADIGVNYNCWTYEDMVNYFSEYGLAEHMDLAALYETMLEEPCLYLKYYVGYLELTQLRNELSGQLGEAFTLRQFHDRILSIGPAPFSLIRQQLISQKEAAAYDAVSTTAPVK